MGNAASSLPYTIGKTPISPNVNDGWNLHDGQRKSDGSPVSVFIAKKPLLQKTIIQSHNNMNTNRNNLTQYNCALHHYMYCKKLRHPNILTVTATLDTDNPNDTAQVSSNASGTGTSTGNSSSSTPAAASGIGIGNTSSSKDTGDLIVVTEPCIPFQVWMNQEPKPTIDQLVWGLQCIINALHFLHASANMCHGNISIDSFYVTPAGDVKLWNFSLVSSYTSTTPPSIPRHFIEYESILTPSIYRSPERVEQRWDVIATSGIHVLDSYSLGIFISQIFQSPIYPLPTPLVKAVQRLQTPNIKMRPKLQPLLKCPIFDTIYPKLQLSIQEFNIMDIESKIQFWNTTLTVQQLTTNIIPKTVILYKILPLMQNEICTIYDNENLRAHELYRKEGKYIYNSEIIIVLQYESLYNTLHRISFV
jgi:SCY1-like protein 1